MLVGWRLAAGDCRLQSVQKTDLKVKGPAESARARFQSPAPSPQPPAPCSGFTVVEVIAAILVLGVGLIGIASLYGEAVQNERETDPRARAQHLALNMAERVKANSTGRTGYASVVGVLCVKEPRSAKPQQAAAQEAACWQDEVEENLPNGTGAITRDLSTNPPTYVVAVSWSAEGSGAASYVVRVQPET
jgi:type IV pilus modification protein PilV